MPLVYGAVGSRSEELPDTSVASSINRDNLQKRFSTLSAYVNEAQWRLVLLSGDNMPSVIKQPKDESDRSAYKDRQASGARRERRKRRRRKKRRFSVVDGNLGAGIISRMLSSPDSLLRFSILQGKLGQADEVVQLFSLQHSSDALELQFSRNLPEILKKLNAGVLTGRTLASKSTFGTDLTAVARAASEGLRATSEMLVIDKILSPDLLPKIPELELLEPDVAASLEFTDLQSIVLADLAYSSCWSFERSLFLLEKALHKLQIAALPEAAKPTAVKGIIAVLKDTIEFFQELSNVTATCLPYVREMQPSRTLSCQLGPLASKNVKDNAKLWEMFFSQFAKVRGLLAEDEQTTVVLLGGEKQYTPERLHVAFLELSMICSEKGVYFGSRKRFDHLGALYEQVKRVSHVLAECKNKTGPPAHQSYFSVLKQSHVGILGTLVLQRQLSILEFGKLEDFAQQLQLDLVNVIIQTCCPTIAVRRDLTFTVPDLGATTYHGSLPTSPQPEPLVRQLLSSLLEILRGACSDTQNEGPFTLDTMVQLILQPQMSNWLESCNQIASVDLNLLISPEEKLAFFANVTNIAWMWAILSHFKVTAAQGKKAVWHQLCSCKLLSQFPVERLIGQKNAFFSIGQIGAINLFDLKHRLLVGSGPVPTHYLAPPNKLVSESRETENYFPPVEPRLLFVLTEGFMTSPKLQILQAEQISEQLNEAMTEYLTNQVEVDIVHEIVCLPEMLRWYRQSFVTDDPTVPYEGLVNFVADIIGGDFKRALQSLQALDYAPPKEEEQGFPFKLEFVPSTTFGIVVDYGSLSSSPSSILKNQSPNSWPPEYVVRYIGQRCLPMARILNLLNSCPEDMEQESGWETPLGRQLSRWRDLSSNKDASLALVIAALSRAGAGLFLWQQIQRCIDEQSFDKALRYAEETFDPGLSLLRECLLTCNAVCQPSSEYPEPWSYVLRIEDPITRFETMVRSLELWSEDECLTVLTACLALSKKHTEVCRLVQEKLKEMQLYKKTVRVLKAGPSGVLRWQDLVKIPPEKVISELQNTARVDLIVEWTHLNEVARLADDRHRRLDHAAEEQDLQDSSFLAKSKQLNYGMQMLVHIRERDKGLYQALVQMPLVLLEQLLMNAEIATADRAISSVKKDLTKEELHDVNKLIEQYAGKALEFTVVEVVPESVDSSSIKSVTDDHFIIPARIPSKEEWTPDSSVTTCMVCLAERFSMFSRRHHCRRCGRVVCASCSQHSLVVAGYRNEPVRVCDSCYEQSVYTQLGTSPSISSGDRFLKSLDTSRSSMPVMRARSDSYRTTPYCLGVEESENESLREEFAYDQAPSISLCLSILKLHSDPRQCGDFMLTLCDDMFTKLVPRNLGRPNPEVDYAIVISMMRSLLLNAKVKFVEANHKTGVEYSDKYLSHLDLTNMLVKGNCAHLIPKEDITSDDAFRRIRDSLLEEERFALAQDVSTKCGLEQNSLWAAWGTICLRAGEWAQARKKFARCLQKFKDHSQTQQESPLLRDIITFLEDFRSSSITKFHLMSTKCSEDAVQLALEECRYYLDNYGSHSSIVSFYQRHGMFTEALRHIIDKVSDVDVFVGNLFMASLRAGRLGVLLQQVRAVDPILGKTWRFLMATCRHLKHESLYRVLYRVQLFMEDYIRAGMTSIHFFRIPASRCSELYERMPHLESARHNFERYLKQDPNGRDTLKLSNEEVQRHLQTVLLQSKISVYLYTCESKDMDIRVGNVTQKMLASERLQNTLPTLFDGVVQKTTLSVLLLVYGAFEEGGMDLALQVILNHNLDGTKVCSLAAQELVNIGGLNEFLALVTYIRIRPASYGLDMDSVIATSIALLANQPGKAKEAEMLIRQMASDANKINAYVVSGLLKSAYFLAIRLGRVSDVERIREAAASTGQLSIQAICDKWLESKKGS